MNQDCIFCRIVTREIPAEIVAESETALAFMDLNPVAPTHVLLIPKDHVRSLHEVEAAAHMPHLVTLGQSVATESGIDSYRVVSNVGLDAGQSVDHLHLHLIAGRSMAWPPG